jgi:uncharacterized protein (TIGR00255 family)
MIRSMTGYGEAERDTSAGRLRLEMKTVNHRFLNTSIKSPSGFDKFDRVIADTVKRNLSRGHVTVFLSVDRSTATAPVTPQVDLDRARAYRAAFEAIRDELDVAGSVDLALLARFSDVFRFRDDDRMEGIDEEGIGQLTERAAGAVLELREAEGTRLEEDLRARMDEIARLLAVAEDRAPERLVEHRDRLRAAVRELTEQADVDEDRLAREVAYMAERWDVNEEIVRFRSHLDLFGEALAGDGSAPVGKRLGFLVQEMLREANTIGAKANDGELTHLSVSMKEEIERIREQVENVE